MKQLFGKQTFVDSVGVRLGELDPFVIAVMEEVGVDMSGHRPKTFEDLQDDNFDMVISLSPEAQHKAIEMTRHVACEVEFWHTLDPSIIEGSREVRLDAFRQIRNELAARLRARFMAAPPVI